jgi:thiol:disulfide interchange protein DsbD
LWKAVGVIALLIGVALLVGALSGGRDPLQPLSGLRAAGAAPNAAIYGVAFERIRTIAELDQRIARAKGRSIMLDFYADWCASCKEMERFTFTDPKVRDQLQRFVLLQADVTHNTEDDTALLQRFGLFGPPGIIFFGVGGKELPHRVVGYQPPEKFITALQATSE